MTVAHLILAALIIAWAAQVVICGAGYAFVLVRKSGPRTFAEPAAPGRRRDDPVQVPARSF